MDSENAVEIIKKLQNSMYIWRGGQIDQALETLLKEREELKTNQDKLLNKLAMLLNITTHVLDQNHQKMFSKIILDNIDKSIDYLRNLLKKCWED